MIKLAVLLICILIFLVKLLNSFFTKKSDEKMFRKAKAKPAIAEQLIDDVRLFYGKTDVSDIDLQHLAEAIRLMTFGKYKVLDTLLSGNKLLLFTLRVHMDWDTKWNGNAGDVKKAQHDFFVIENDKENRKATIYGDNYLDVNDKLMKTEFVKELIEAVSLSVSKI